MPKRRSLHVLNKSGYAEAEVQTIVRFAFGLINRKLFRVFPSRVEVARARTKGLDNSLDENGSSVVVTLHVGPADLFPQSTQIKHKNQNQIETLANYQEGIFVAALRGARALVRRFKHHDLNLPPKARLKERLTYDRFWRRVNTGAGLKAFREAQPAILAEIADRSLKLAEKSQSAETTAVAKKLAASAPESKLAALLEKQKTWTRKKKLAETKLRQLRRKIKYYEKRIAEKDQ